MDLYETEKVPHEKSLPTCIYRFQTSHSKTISHVRNRRWLGMAAQVCDPSTQEAKVRGFQVEGHQGPHRIKRNLSQRKGRNEVGKMAEVEQMKRQTFSCFT